MHLHNKKIITILCLLAFLLSLVGCGNFNQDIPVGGEPEDISISETNTYSDSLSETETSVTQTSETQYSQSETNALTEAITSPFNSGTHIITEKDGITYVDGILIVNKSYPLPESYNPGKVLDYVNDAFLNMQSDAAKEGLNLYISSGFRSYEYQKGLYQRYVDHSGQAEADTYSARPGYSEHQSGLCFDLNTIDDSFATTAEGKWVAENCYKYGFIIRFPKDKDAYTGYKYEPWHLRYLGIDTATSVYNSKLSLEEYLGITSQYVK